MYELLFSPAAEKYLRKLKDKKLKATYREALERISADPYIGCLKRGDLTGVYGYDIRYSGTNYEMSYKIYEEPRRLVVVILAGTRENFYVELKSYLKRSKGIPQGQ